jgi:hypothetical protein
MAADNGDEPEPWHSLRMCDLCVNEAVAPMDDDTDDSGPQTWDETGSPLQPFVVAKYDLDTVYHPDKANMDWEVTTIQVAIIGPDNYDFYDQDGNCLNPGASFWGQLPTLNDILTFLQNME